jgi:hypothetical protein
MVLAFFSVCITTPPVLERTLDQVAFKGVSQTLQETILKKRMYSTKRIIMLLFLATLHADRQNLYFVHALLQPHHAFCQNRNIADGSAAFLATYRLRITHFLHQKRKRRSGF